MAALYQEPEAIEIDLDVAEPEVDAWGEEIAEGTEPVDEVQREKIDYTKPLEKPTFAAPVAPSFSASPFAGKSNFQGFQGFNEA